MLTDCWTRVSDRGSKEPFGVHVGSAQWSRDLCTAVTFGKAWTLRLLRAKWLSVSFPSVYEILRREDLEEAYQLIPINRIKQEQWKVQKTNKIIFPGHHAWAWAGTCHSNTWMQNIKLLQNSTILVSCLIALQSARTLHLTKLLLLKRWSSFKDYFIYSRKCTYLLSFICKYT